MKKIYNYFVAALMFTLLLLFFFNNPLEGFGGEGYDVKLHSCFLGFYHLIMVLWFLGMSFDPHQRSLASICGVFCGMAGIFTMLLLYSINFNTENPADISVRKVLAVYIMYNAVCTAYMILMAILCGKAKNNKALRFTLIAAIASMILSLLFGRFFTKHMESYFFMSESMVYLFIGLSIILNTRNREEEESAVEPDAIPASDQATTVERPAAPQSAINYSTVLKSINPETKPSDVAKDGTIKPGGTLQNGRYRIEGVLGQGGFGITYKAVQTGLNRTVAIKEFFMKEFCDRDATGNRITMGTEGSRELVEKFKNKFIKEAQVIAEMQNDHIVRIYDVFEENNTAYYVMEYISGGNLAARISGTPTEENVAYGYVRQICDALKYLHERSILHLDIKPSNIMFRDNNELVLIDFGISKHYDKEEGSQTSSTPIGISRGYAPLEQYKPGGVSTFSPATDIYSVGATLYNMITGQLPPEAEDVNEEGLEPFPCEVSEKFRNAIVKAMEPRRRMRPQSIDEFMNLFNS